MSDHLANVSSQAAALGSSIQRLVQQAYDAGYRDGGLAMRDEIIRAANAPLSIMSGSIQMGNVKIIGTGAASGISTAPGVGGNVTPVSPEEPKASRSETRQAVRAPRGLVRRAVEEVLTAEPGLSVIEVEDRVVARYPEIARKTVGNQLRGQEGELYRREGKYNWFLVGDAQKETATSDLPSDIADLLGQTERR